MTGAEGYAGTVKWEAGFWEEAAVGPPPPLVRLSSAPRGRGTTNTISSVSTTSGAHAREAHEVEVHHARQPLGSGSRSRRAKIWASRGS